MERLFILTTLIWSAALSAFAQYPPYGAWSGSAECRLDIKGPGYYHSETQTWILSRDTPSQPGGRTYQATWSVKGQGSSQSTRGTQASAGQWTISVSGVDAPLDVLVRASDRHILIRSGHSQLRAPNAVTGTRQLTEAGTAQRPTPMGLDTFEWAFPFIEGAHEAGRLKGSSTSAINGSVGPMQPSGSSGTATCTWDFSQGTARVSPSPAASTAPNATAGTASTTGGAAGGGAPDAAGSPASTAGGAASSGKTGASTGAAGGGAAGAPGSPASTAGGAAPGGKTGGSTGAAGGGAGAAASSSPSASNQSAAGSPGAGAAPIAVDSTPAGSKDSEGSCSSLLNDVQAAYQRTAASIEEMFAKAINEQKGSLEPKLSDERRKEVLQHIDALEAAKQRTLQELSAQQLRESKEALRVCADSHAPDATKNADFERALAALLAAFSDTASRVIMNMK